ncbi:hypothetical protein EJD97_004399, partial [Solanum chilense]
EEYNNNFPKISNNFTRYDHNLQADRINKQGGMAIHDSTRQIHSNQQSQQPNSSNTKDQNNEPAPYTIVQSFAARLRYNQAKNEIPICLNEPVHTTRQGLPAVLIYENDYYVKLAEICKYTLVGKFTNTMPRMEQVRKSLPLHCYNKVFLSTILESIGKVLLLDSPTSQRIWGSTTRVKVQVDLTEERPSHVWLGFKNSNPNKGRWLKVEYESIPSYCFYCRHQGHKDEVCTIKRRDEDIQKRNVMDAAKNRKEKGTGKIQE